MKNRYEGTDEFISTVIRKEVAKLEGRYGITKDDLDDLQQELHLQVWPLGRPAHGYFYGYNETITYVDRIWEIYQVYKKIL